eukprot:scaffold4492_cov81-Skeletonema_menzelii.AAC.2
MRHHRGVLLFRRGDDAHLQGFRVARSTRNLAAFSGLKLLFHFNPKFVTVSNGSGPTTARGPPEHFNLKRLHPFRFPWVRAHDCQQPKASIGGMPPINPSGRGVP